MRLSGKLVLVYAHQQLMPITCISWLSQFYSFLAVDKSDGRGLSKEARRHGEHLWQEDPLPATEGSILTARQSEQTHYFSS